MCRQATYAGPLPPDQLHDAPPSYCQLPPATPSYPPARPQTRRRCRTHPSARSGSGRGPRWKVEAAPWAIPVWDTWQRVCVCAGVAAGGCAVRTRQAVIVLNRCLQCVRLFACSVRRRRTLEYSARHRCGCHVRLSTAAPGQQATVRMPHRRRKAASRGLWKAMMDHGNPYHGRRHSHTTADPPSGATSSRTPAAA